MCEAVEKYADRKMLDKQIELIKNLMDSMKWSAEQAMTAMKVSDADRAMLLEKLWVGADKIRTENERLCKRICRKVCGVKGRNCKTYQSVGVHKKAYGKYEVGGRTGNECA